MELTCPSCGKPNDPSRTFCARCGQVLRTSSSLPGQTSVGARASRQPWWTALFGDPEERAARRAYRRSLPAFYRWRRVAVTLLVVVAIGLLAIAMARDPLGWMKQRWYDLTSATEPVDGVTAISPGGTKVPGLVDDNDQSAWTTTWPAHAQAPASCVPPEGVGTVVLVMPVTTRVRGLQIEAGLAKGSQRRALQFRPKRIDVTWQGHCVALTVGKAGDAETKKLDTKVPVSRIGLSIGEAYDSLTPDKDGMISIREVTVLRRPAG